MVKASVSFDGAHKWAQHKYLRPVDFLFIFKRVSEAVLMLLIVLYIIYLLSLAVLDGELKINFWVMMILEVLYVFNFVKSFIDRDKFRKKMLAEGPDGFRREYTINEVGVFADFRSEEEWGSGLLKYDGIKSAVETDDFFVIGVDKYKIYSIRKSEITEGSPVELTALLRKKLGSRFRRKVR